MKFFLFTLGVAPMVHAAKALAVNMGSAEKAADWRTKNNLVSFSFLQFFLPFAKRYLLKFRGYFLVRVFWQGIFETGHFLFRFALACL